ncbi:MAG: WbqC family protein [Muribaculaceae bacterium]
MTCAINHLCDCAAFGSTYLGSVQYYAAMLAAKQPIIHSSQQSITKLWGHNHCRICGPNGVQQLVIPIEKDTYYANTPISDVVISEHGNWRHQHWGALFSSYGKSPFFDYVADDLERIIHGNQHFLLDLNMQLHQLVVDFLDLPIECSLSPVIPDGAADWRKCVGEKNPAKQIVHDEPYYQLWAERFGFVPNLSIIDMLCNVGREAVFTLIDMTKKQG